MTETKSAPTGTEVALRRDSMPSKIQYAKALADSGLLPSAYRQNPANILWAVEYGEMLGLSSMAAITGVHIIEGKPTASAGLISALVRRAGHRLRVTGDARSATCQIIRADDPEYTFEVTFTMEDADRAGLTGKKVWKQYGASMLKSRAITQCARDACEEALFGLHYTPEELGAEVDAEGNVVGGEMVPGGQPGQPAAQPDGEVITDAEVVGDPEWLHEMTEKAGRFATEDEGRELWRETAAKLHGGEISKPDSERIAELIKTRAEKIQQPEPLDPEDPWAVRVEEVTSQDDAEQVIAEAVEQCKAGTLDVTHANRVRAAALARAAGASPEPVAS